MSGYCNYFLHKHTQGFTNCCCFLGCFVIAWQTHLSLLLGQVVVLWLVCLLPDLLVR